MGAPRPGGSAPPSVVTIGNFDGVHVGHRKLIGEAMSLAVKAGWRSVALTFDRHPATVVRPGSAPPLLTDPQQKVELLEATGVDEVVVLTFDRARADETAEEFVRELLVGRLGARAVVVGSSFRFGNRQQGDAELLAKLGGELGFEVRALELVADNDASTPVSSSRIRALLLEGQLEHANRLLGRPYQVRAHVVTPQAILDPDRQPTVDPDGQPTVDPDRQAILDPDRQAILEQGMCLPLPGEYEGLVGPLAAPGRPARLLLDGATVACDALGGEAPGTAVLVQFRAFLVPHAQ